MSAPDQAPCLRTFMGTVGIKIKHQRHCWGGASLSLTLVHIISKSHDPCLPMPSCPYVLDENLLLPSALGVLKSKMSIHGEKTPLVGFTDFPSKLLLLETLQEIRVITKLGGTQHLLALGENKRKCSFLSWCPPRQIQGTWGHSVEFLANKPVMVLRP